MGVVIRQSFWGTFIAYTGVIVGYANTLYFRAEYLTLEQIGLFSLITANAMMISPISSLGSGSSYIKYFPSFSDNDKYRFFSFLFLVVIVGNVLIISIGYALKDVIALRYLETAPTYADYLFVTAIVIISNSFFDLLFSYSRSILSITFPSFLREVYLRLGTFFLVIGYAMEWWSFHWAIVGLGLVYLLAAVLLLANLLLFHSFRFDFHVGIINSKWKRNLFQFGSYSMALAGSFAIINNISYDQITIFLGSEMAGIFTTCFFIGVVVEMPRRNMAKVMMPIVSRAFTENDQKTIASIYQRSSITMSVFGVLFSIGIITNLQDLFAFIPKGEDFQIGYWVVVLVCLAKLALMVSSFAGEIINFSTKYQYNLLFQIIAALILVIANFFLIPVFGITGAGISYLVSILFHIFLKAVFVYMSFGLSPLIRNHFKLFLIAVFVFCISLFFSLSLHPIITIAIRSTITSILFLILIYRFKISTDINRIVHSIFEYLNINRSQ